MKYRIIWRRKTDASAEADAPRPRSKRKRGKSCRHRRGRPPHRSVIVIANLSSRREKTVRVTVEKASLHDLTSVISASGEVKPKKNINISAHVPGRIIKIGVVEGQVVKAGDFLLKLDSTQYEANADRDQNFIRAANADLILSEARFKRDKNSLERQQKLFEEDLISKDQLEQAEAQFDVSAAQTNAIIIDFGVGMSPEILASIFHPFFTTKVNGTGLGLAIVHRILEAYGCRLDVESAPGRGTAFSLNFQRLEGPVASAN